VYPWVYIIILAKPETLCARGYLDQAMRTVLVYRAVTKYVTLKTWCSITFKDRFNNLPTSNESKLYVHLSPDEKIPEYLLTFT